TVRLVADIARHAKDRAIVVLDWIGRYSYEWQDLWSTEMENEHFMDYRISYIYPPEERGTADIESFPLRLMYSEEATRMIEEASRQARVQINIKQFFDRSIFVGRHMDTADYNKHCPSIRKMVNSLLEPNQRTDLNELFLDYMPKQGFPVINSFFEMFSMSWNALVRHTVEFLQEYHDSERQLEERGPDRYEYYPAPLREAVGTMRRVISTTGDLPGDTRANIIEPQLAFALRKLEMELQSGIGTGHGLVGILEIVKE
ncbi:MAG: class I SAM-dependent methyltransferase, partial [Nitrospirota bacterium]